MALFNRRKQGTDVLPTEVREYYQSERRERTGLAWLLAIGTLLATFLIAAGLFFGGRWAYRTVFNHNDDDKKTASSQNDDGLRIDDKGNVIGSTEVPSSGTSSTSTNTPSPDPTASANKNPSTPAKTSNTGATLPAQLVNTGPGDE